MEFQEGQTAPGLGLDGTEIFHIEIDDGLQPRQPVNVAARRPEGGEIRFTARARIDTPVEIDYYRNGGILHTVLKEMAAG